ncbi:YdeI/OmpD-associated family protein [Agromyces sp. SYSU T0242]|uniref:YdeI/OmpD-associated family protein n=1 Tax=Agromyces litoreus TaxID=3158561 RepID=UPI003396E616
MRFETTMAQTGNNTGIEVPAEVVEALGGGDAITVELELDREPRVVEVPEDFAAALDGAPGARAAFEKLAPSHRKAHVTAITDAKTPETRQRRIAKAIEKLVGD